MATPPNGVRYDGGMRRWRKIFTYILRGVSYVFGATLVAAWITSSVAKAMVKVVDWTGRTTFWDDATQLGKKLNAMSAWLLEQPSLLFYGTAAALGVIGIFLIVAPALPIRKFVEDRIFTIFGKKNHARLGFVMRSHPPFVDNIVITPNEGVISYHTRYIGIRNLQSEKTINNVRMQVIGGDQASSEVPMPLLDRNGKSSLSLSPNEVHLFVFTQQAINQDGGYGIVRIPGADGSHVSVVSKGEQIVRLGAYGDDASATAEFVFRFNQKGRLQVHPPKIGD